MNDLIAAIKTIEAYRERLLSLYPPGPVKEDLTWEVLPDGTYSLSLVTTSPICCGDYDTDVQYFPADMADQDLASIKEWCDARDKKNREDYEREQALAMEKIEERLKEERRRQYEYYKQEFDPQHE